MSKWTHGEAFNTFERLKIVPPETRGTAGHAGSHTPIVWSQQADRQRNWDSDFMIVVAGINR